MKKEQNNEKQLPRQETIESRSSGMKGTYIKVLNDVVFDELKKIDLTE